MSKIIVTIKDKDVSNIIKRRLNTAAYVGDATRPYEKVAMCFAEFFLKQNPKFNAENFLKKCSTDYKGNRIHIHD